MACGHCSPSCTHQHQEEHPEVPEHAPAGGADHAPRACCAGSDRSAPDGGERLADERSDPGRAG